MLGPRVVAAIAVLIAAEPQASSAPLADHDIRVPKTVSVVVGSRGSVSVTIRPKGRFRISRRGGVRIDVSVAPSTGLGLTRTRYRRRHAADPRADSPRFDIRYRPTKSGSYQLKLALAFWVCGRHTCRPIRTTRAVTVSVSTKKPTPPSEGGKK